MWLRRERMPSNENNCCSKSALIKIWLNFRRHFGKKSSNFFSMQKNWCCVKMAHDIQILLKWWRLWLDWLVMTLPKTELAFSSFQYRKLFRRLYFKYLFDTSQSRSNERTLAVHFLFLFIHFSTISLSKLYFLFLLNSYSTISF